MDGMCALEVGMWDGFRAFEMERRGAEVVALDLDDKRDLDWPRRPESFPRRVAQQQPPRRQGDVTRGRRWYERQTSAACSSVASPRA
jgi:hypothetical protein